MTHQIRASAGAGAMAGESDDLLSELLERLTHVETAHSGLTQANAELKGSHDALLRANRELQASNDDLRAGNARLQATNDELRESDAVLRALINEHRESEAVLRDSNAELRELNSELRASNSELQQLLSVIMDENARADRKQEALSVVQQQQLPLQQELQQQPQPEPQQPQPQQPQPQQPQPQQPQPQQLQPQQPQPQRLQLQQPQPQRLQLQQPQPQQLQLQQPQPQQLQLQQPQMQEQLQPQQQQLQPQQLQPQQLQPQQLQPQQLQPQQLQPQPQQQQLQLQPQQQQLQLQPQPQQQQLQLQPQQEQLQPQQQQMELDPQQQQPHQAQLQQQQPQLQQQQPQQQEQQLLQQQQLLQELQEQQQQQQLLQELQEQQAWQEHLLGVVGPPVEDPEAERAFNYQTLMDMELADLVPNMHPFDCPICFVPCTVMEGIVLRDCLHNFCRACLQHTVQFSEEATIKCPFRDENYACESVLRESEIKALVSVDVYEEHLARSLAKVEAQTGNAFHCKTPDCGGWCIFEDVVNQFPCPVCLHTNCLTCQTIHEGKNCRQYQDHLKVAARTNDEARQTQEAIEEMLQSREAMRCPLCQVVIKKKGGCDFLTCSMCNTGICWVTRGPRWGPGGRGDVSGGCRCKLNGNKCHPDCRNCH